MIFRKRTRIIPVIVNDGSLACLLLQSDTRMILEATHARVLNEYEPSVRVPGQTAGETYDILSESISRRRIRAIPLRERIEIVGVEDRLEQLMEMVTTYARGNPNEKLVIKPVRIVSKMDYRTLKANFERL